MTLGEASPFASVGCVICQARSMTVALGDCEVHDLSSAAVGDDFRIFVGHCHGQTAEGLPALFVSDANGAFGMTVDIVRHLQLGGHLPPMLVVGIGYPVATLRQTIAQRTRDLTPTVSPVMKDGDGRPLASGGAAAFLAFIADELEPWLAARFPIGENRTYVGHSLGGLFGAYVLLGRPVTFGNYVLVSPSIWWDDHHILRVEADYARDHRDLDAAVLVTVGGHETSEGRVRAAAHLPGFARAALIAPARDMVRDAETFVDALAGRRYPQLSLRYRTMADEDHVSIPPVAISQSLRVLFNEPGHATLIPERRHRR